MNQPPRSRPPPRNSRGPYMIRAYEKHWFPLIRPAIKSLFRFGGYVIGDGGEGIPLLKTNEWIPKNDGPWKRLHSSESRWRNSQKVD